MPVTKNLEKTYLNRPIADLDALKSINTVGVPLPSGLTVEVAGITGSYGGKFVWVANSSDVGDDRNTVTPNDSPGLGRWKRSDINRFKLNSNNKIDASLLPIDGPFIYRGSLSIPSDFPTLASVSPGDVYNALNDVTDNDITRTHTLQTITQGSVVAWNDNSWSDVGADIIIRKNGTFIEPIFATDNYRSEYIVSTVVTGTRPIQVTSTTMCTNLNADLLDGEQLSTIWQWDHSITGDLTTHFPGDNVDFGTGGLKDADVTTVIGLGDANNTYVSQALGTATSLIGGINNVTLSLYDTNMTGFISWGGSGAYYSFVGDTFTLLRPGTGRILGELRAWTAPQVVTVSDNVTGYIAIDDSGTLISIDYGSITDATYVSNIVLFEALYTGAVNAVNIAVKENHDYDDSVSLSRYLHNNLGTLIRKGLGANITKIGAGTGASVTDRQLKIVGSTYLDDHGLSTAIPDTATTAINFKRMYLSATGKWFSTAETNEVLNYYDNGGTLTLSAQGRFTGHVVYVSKDDLNSSSPTYYIVTHSADFNSAALVNAAISNGTLTIATNELDALELARLGYLVVGRSADGSYISSIVISKSVPGSATIVGAGSATSHLLLSDLNTGDAGHSQFAYLGGRVGGQIQYGDTASGGTYTISSTSHVTKGVINIGSAGTSNFDEATGALTILSGISGSRLTSTIATGTSPLVVTSTTKVANLNVDRLDDLDSTAFAILAGQSGGQTLNGGTAASNNLTLVSTANATKGNINLGAAATSFFNETTNYLTITGLHSSKTYSSDSSHVRNFPLGVTYSASFYASINGDYSLANGSLTNTGGNGITAENGYLDLSHSDSRYLLIPAANNIVNTNVGTLKFIYNPDYTGIPATDQLVFLLYTNGAGSPNFLFLYHLMTSGDLQLSIYNSASVGYSYNLVAGWLPALGSDHEIEVNWDTTNQVLRLFVDGTKYEQAIATVLSRTAPTALEIGGQFLTNNFRIKKLVVYPTVQHTANYTPGYTCIDYPITNTLAALPATTFPNLGVSRTDTRIEPTHVSDTLNMGTAGRVLGSSFTIPLIEDATFYATFASSVDANFSHGDPTGTLGGSATITGGYLTMTAATLAYADFSGAKNGDMAQQGGIKFILKPNYTGNPASLQCFFSFMHTSGKNNNVIQLIHNTNGQLVVIMYDQAGVAIGSTLYAADSSFVSGTPIMMEFYWDLTNGVQTLWKDGSQVGTTKTLTGTRSNVCNTLRIGNNSLLSYTVNRHSIKDVVVYSKPQTNHAAYTLSNSFSKITNTASRIIGKLDILSGNVGIGNTNSRGRLDISTEGSSGETQNIFIGCSNTLHASSGGLNWAGNFGAYSKISAKVIAVNEGNYFRQGLALYTGNDADSSTDAIERVRITMNGGVAIGATAATAGKLRVVYTVAKDDTFHDRCLRLEGGRSGYAQIFADGNDTGAYISTTGSDGTKFSLYCVSNSVINFQVMDNGNVFAAGVYDDTVGATNRDLYIDNTGKIGYVSSSIRYKNIVDRVIDTSWLYDVKVTAFTYINDPFDKLSIGGVAENLRDIINLLPSDQEEMFRDIVIYEQERLADISTVNEYGEILSTRPRYKDKLDEKCQLIPESIQYSKLIMPILHEVQKQKKHIDELELRITSLENHILSALEA